MGTLSMRIESFVALAKADHAGLEAVSESLENANISSERTIQTAAVACFKSSA